MPPDTFRPIGQIAASLAQSAEIVRLTDKRDVAFNEGNWEVAESYHLKLIDLQITQWLRGDQ